MQPSEDDTIRQVLDYLGGDLDPSILIGGWATHFRVGGEISHDIDLIVTNESRYRLTDAVTDLSTTNQSDGSSKQRGDVEGVHVDIYTPHESKLGSRLLLKVEILIEHTEPLEGSKWLLLTIEAHILTKMAAILDRHASAKGEKDARELLALLWNNDGEVSPEKAAKIAIQASTATEAVPDLISEAFRLIAALTPRDKAKRAFLATTQKHWARALRSEVNAAVPRPAL
jgi:hypothetical protein